MERTKNVKNPGQKNIHILANDPSICAWGYSVLDQNGNVLDFGCIKTESGGKKMRIRKSDDRTRRVHEINERLLSMIKKYNVEYMVSELPHGSQNASAAVMIGACIGIMQTLSDTLQIGLEWFSENDSKKCALGKSTAEKKEMIEAMSKIYDIKWTGTKYIDEAVADSLAIHYVASKDSPALKLFRL
jgi:Holliday junction resolvasome RuvABC endonuclease subunit